MRYFDVWLKCKKEGKEEKLSDKFCRPVKCFRADLFRAVSPGLEERARRGSFTL
jgi:hypothetical protein